MSNWPINLNNKLVISHARKSRLNTTVESIKEQVFETAFCFN